MKKTLFSSLLSLSAGIFLLTAAAQADVLKIKPTHPERYTVVKGDTLWDISGRFLEHPWEWPEIWQINPQIEDPHWIYPGDVVELVYINGKPQLRKASGRVVLTPQMRIRDVAICPWQIPFNVPCPNRTTRFPHPFRRNPFPLSWRVATLSGAPKQEPVRRRLSPCQFFTISRSAQSRSNKDASGPWS